MTKSQSLFNHEQFQISSITFQPVESNDGLLGFACLIINGCLKLNSIAVYRKLGGGLRLLYPTKKNGLFSQTVFQPLTPDLSKKIEKEVFSYLAKNHFSLTAIKNREQLS